MGGGLKSETEARQNLSHPRAEFPSVVIQVRPPPGVMPVRGTI